MPESTQLGTKRNPETVSAVKARQGTVFTGRTVFHNLKPEELGALVRALTCGCSYPDRTGSPSRGRQHLGGPVRRQCPAQDSPGGHRCCRGGQPYGKKSTEHLSGLAASRFVVVYWQKRDRYGRIVGKVLLGEEGLAWHYKRYQKEQTPEDLDADAGAEEEAREARQGLDIHRHVERVKRSNLRTLLC